MSRASRLLWVTTLLAFISGCSSYRYAVLPQASNISEFERVVVEPRSNVKVTLTSGGIVAGEVVRANESELVIGRPGNYGFEEQVIRAAEISKIEVEYSSPGNKVVVYSLIGVTALVIVGFVALADGLEKSLSGMN